ncbi:hypothetical protein HDV03_003466 [Kappamyces sp. JEL0829]|nr:hypothetical protein HDV03_003466 [Kappamyces sp. JEL0829]
MYPLALLVSVVACISELDYPRVYAQTVEPFFQSGVQAKFVGKDGAKVNYWSYIQPNGTSDALVISPGRNVPLKNWVEAAYDMKDLGLSFYILDHRGQGNSDRLGSGPEVQHVNLFQDYVDDFTTFYDLIVKPNNHPKKLVLGDSMGGAIAAMFNKQHPAIYDGAILSSPMFGINTDPYSQLVARALATSAVALGQGKNFALGQKGWVMGQDVSNSSTTTSAARYTNSYAINVADPATKLGGVSYNWIKQVLDTTGEFKKATNGPLVTVPTIMFQAQNETVVVPADEDLYCSNTPAKCTKTLFQGSKHEIFFERDEIRNQALAVTREFIQQIRASL